MRQELLLMTSVAFAKTHFKRDAEACFIGPPGNRFELLRLKHHSDERQVATSFFNGVVKFAAEEGQTEEAERWMCKLDSTRGYKPSVEAFNALLRSATLKQDWAKADEWFNRPDTPGLHPELGRLQPNGESFDIMIQAAAACGDMVRGERYLRLAEERGWKVARKSMDRIVRKFLERKESRRAHHWAHTLVKEGCRDVESYEPWVVRNENHKLRSEQVFAPSQIYDLVGALAKSLSDQGNTQTANEWLEYLVECGVNSQDYKELWDYVRKATPLEICPAALYAELGDLDFLQRTACLALPSSQPVAPMAAVLLPATLSGEERGVDGKFRHRHRRPSRNGGSGSFSRADSRSSSIDGSVSPPRKALMARPALTSPAFSRPASAAAGRAATPVQCASTLWGVDGKRPMSPEEYLASTRAPSSCSQTGSRALAVLPPAGPSPGLASAAAAHGGGAGSGGGRAASPGKARFPRGLDPGRKSSPSRQKIAQQAAGLGMPQGVGSVGLHRLLEARRNVASADRAATARRGVDAWLSARGCRPLPSATAAAGMSMTITPVSTAR